MLSDLTRTHLLVTLPTATVNATSLPADVQVTENPSSLEPAAAHHRSAGNATDVAAVLR